MIYIDNLSLLGVTPISADKPAGDNISVDNDFENLKREIEKHNSYSAEREAVNWKTVETLGYKLLSQKSKHFQVAAYWGAARIQLAGFQGIIDSSSLFKGLVEHFWDSAWPAVKRLKGRMNSVQWWLDSSYRWAEHYEGPKIDPVLIDKAVELISEFEALLENQCECDDVPIMRGLISSIKRLPVKESQVVLPIEDMVTTEALEIDTSSVVENVIAEKGPIDDESITHDIETGQLELTSELPSVKPKQQSNAAAPIPTLDDMSLPDDDIKVGMSLLLRSADKIFRQDMNEASSYHLRRLAVWSALSQAPTVISGNKTRLPSPATEDKNILRISLDDGTPSKVITCCENRVSQYLFWLDLSFHTYTALKNLGNESAMIAIEAAVLDFDHRCPEVKNLCFDDGLPFAGPDTLMWLQSLKGSEESNTLSECDLLLSEAKVLSAGGHFNDAIIKLTGSINRVTLAEECQIRILLAEIMSKAGATLLAIEHINTAIGYIDAHKLNEWSPKLALEILRCAYELMRAAENIEQSNEILKRVNMIDPAMAMTLQTVQQF
ncbi:type VI secretion system protein TssA [Shewanella surugensis]|uniref:Type VI secretion system protein TssA n=1 Tax=Shewanella surugensis TaxID=212020 RepID=A0ABT0L6Y8_9GAMM|nr:type VI secretion system protein TssA [Shewanella surugensis]MCL1123464.1 type VI secretion system protein TssA [Shewanella surugensis]